MGRHAYKRHVLRTRCTKGTSIGRLVISGRKSLETQRTQRVSAVESPSTIVGFQRNPNMVRRKQKTAVKKRVRWLDQIQAEASRPRASYTPPQLDEADILKFINKETAKQRRAQVNRMAGVAFGEQALRSYTAAQKKQRLRASRHPPM